MRSTRGTGGFPDSTRWQVVRLLRRGAASVDELARDLRVTPNAVRFHLRTLERDALVRAAGVRRADGAGKPSTVYEIVPEAEAGFSSAYVPLLRALLQALATHLPLREREELLRSAAKALAADPDVAALAVGGRPPERAARVLEGLGGLVEVTSEGDATVIQGFGCPVSSIVGDHPEVCGAIRALLSEVVGGDVRERCQRDGRPRCRFAMPSA